jgi:hypothetical protein
MLGDARSRPPGATMPAGTFDAAPNLRETCIDRNSHRWLKWRYELIKEATRE